MLYNQGVLVWDSFTSSIARPILGLKGRSPTLMPLGLEWTRRIQSNLHSVEMMALGTTAKSFGAEYGAACTEIANSRMLKNK